MVRLTEVRLLAARRQIANIHRDGKDLVFTDQRQRLIRKLAERAGSVLRVVVEKQTYWRPPSL
jgi:hypothetical protein